MVNWIITHFATRRAQRLQFWVGLMGGAIVCAIILMPTRPVWASAFASESPARANSVLTPPCFERIPWWLATDGTTLYAAPDQQPLAFLDISYDLGATWTFVELSKGSASIPSFVMEELTARNHSTRVCDPEDPQICLEQHGPWEVRETHDGGKTYRVAWHLTDHRREYVAMWVNRGAPGSSCMLALETAINDLALLKAGDKVVPVIALGNVGVVIGQPDGSWTRHLLGSDIPLSGAPNGGALVFFLLPEIDAFLAFVVIAWASLSKYCWNCLRTGPKALSEEVVKSLDRRYRASMGLLVIPLLLLIVIWIDYDPAYFHSIRLLLASIIFFLAALVGMITINRGWARIRGAAGNLDRVQEMKRISVATSLGVGMVWFTFVLWSVGFIPGYRLAVILSAVGAAAVLAWGVTSLRSLNSADRANPQ